jgi:hypothetical protein
MRQLRRSVALVAFVCAFALLATSAIAEEFHASSTGETRGKNFEETPQTFKFGSIHITCLKAAEKGEVLAGPKKELFDSVKYGKCSTEAKLGANTIFLKTAFLTPIDFEYHSNGFAEFGGSSESELKLIAPSSVEIKIPSIRCVIEIPPQTIPVKAVKVPEGEYSAVSYFTEEYPTTNKKVFPSGFRKKLVIENELKGINYEYTEGQCSEFEKTEGKGQYIGPLLDERVGGDLWFE